MPSPLPNLQNRRLRRPADGTRISRPTVARLTEALLDLPRGFGYVLGLDHQSLPVLSRANHVVQPF